MKKMYRQWLGIAALLCHITMQAAGNKAVVTGTVKDTQGNPIAGVVVTDGKHVTATDRQGIYMLDTDPFRQPMVYISTPADYVLPEKEWLMAFITIRILQKWGIVVILFFRNVVNRPMILYLFLFQILRLKMKHSWIDSVKKPFPI
jgi:hypothetical protein